MEERPAEAEASARRNHQIDLILRCSAAAELTVYFSERSESPPSDDFSQRLSVAAS